MFTDSHAHITSDSVFPSVNEVLERAHLAGVSSIINIATDKISLERALSLVSEKVHLFHAGATTPHDVALEGERFFSAFEHAAMSGKLIAIGETGLDYHYEHSPKELQQEYFVKYLALAKKAELPVIIHCRDAFSDFFSLVDKHYGKESVLLHCFTGSMEEAMQAIERGFMISFSGIVTFKKSEELRAIAKKIPLEQLLVETDTPYLAPQSKRGKMCEPAFVVETAEKIAALHEITLEECALQTTENANRFFRIRSCI